MTDSSSVQNRLATLGPGGWTMSGAFPDDSGIYVLTGEERPAAIYTDETSGLTTTVVRKTVPGGAKQISIGLFPSTKAAADAALLYFVPNAFSNSDEDAKLAAPGLRYTIPVGFMQTFYFPDDAPLLRYAITSNVASETIGNVCLQIVGNEL